MLNTAAGSGTVNKPDEHCTQIRQEPKLQAWLSILVNVNGRETGMFCLVTIENLIGKNLIIDWEYCFGCNGYAREGIHSCCLFAGYDYNSPRSKDLSFNIDTTETGVNVGFRGKVMSTYWSKGKEHIQVKITNIEEETYQYIRNALQSDFSKRKSQ
jgi:hypothetical protein